MNVKSAYRSLSLMLLALIALAASVAITGGWYLLRLRIVPLFADIELIQVRRDAERVGLGIYVDLEALDKFCADWADWDETRNAVRGINPSFVTEHVTLGWMVEQSMSTLVLFGDRNQVQGAVARQDDVLGSPSVDLVAFLAAQTSKDRSPRHGLIQNKETGAMMFSIVPVRDETMTKTIGHLAMVRVLDGAYIAELSRRFDVDISVDPTIPQTFSRSASINGDKVESGFVVADSGGRPALKLTVRKTRILQAPLLEALQKTLTAIAIVVIASGITIWFAIWYYLLGPIGRISATLRGSHTPSASSPLAGQLPTRRRDEIGEIATEIVAMHERILELTQSDPLTNLPNRRAFADRVENAILRMTRNGGTLAILYIDLDGFKPINDTHGHAAGDAVLIACARNISEVLRAGDIVARLGGDEFAVLVHGPIEGPSQECFIDRVAAAVARPCHFENRTLHVTASIGVAIYPADGMTLAALVAKADQGMYADKAARKSARAKVS